MAATDQDQIKVPKGFTLKAESAPQTATPPEIKIPKGFTLKGQSQPAPAAPPTPHGFTLSKASTANTPQQKIYDATINEGQTPDRAWQRVHEYDYAIKQGLNPERAMQFSQSLQWDDASKKVLTEDEIKAVADNVRGMSEEDRKKNFIFGDPMEFARGYAEARARGMSEDDAVEYGSSNSAQRAMMRAGQWIGPKWTNFKASILRTLGASDEGAHVTLKEAAEAPLVATLFGQTRQDYAFNIYRDASWVDKHIGKTAGSLEAHLDNLIAGLTTPEMAALEVASFGEAGLSRVLPEVGEEATAAAKAARFTQRTIRTTQQLAHAGFTAQMAAGSAESFGSAWNEGKEGNVHEAIGYTLDGLVNGLMAASGVRSVEAHAEVARALDETTGKVYPEKKFSQLSDKQQALMIQKLIDDDPKFKEAQGQSQKEMQKNARRLQRRYSEAVGQAWNPNAAERAVRKLYADREELARKNQESAVLDAIREAHEKEEAVKAVAREKIVSGNATARERNVKAREEREKETPRPQATQTVPTTIVGGEKVYGPVTILEQPSYIGVDDIGNRVYVLGEDGSKQYLNDSGWFGPGEGHEFLDEETARTAAKIQALKPTAGPERGTDHLDNVTQHLIDGEITARNAQDVTGIGGEDRLPDEHDTAKGEGIEGPFAKGKKTFFDNFDRAYDEALLPPEKKDGSRAQREAAAWEETNQNLNMLTRSGDQIIDRKGQVWTLGADNVLHGPNGREVPLMKDGLYSNRAMTFAAYGRIKYGTQSYEEMIKPPEPLTEFGSKLKASLERPIKSKDQPLIPVDSAMEGLGRELSKSAESSTPKTLEDAIYDYAIPRNMDPHSLAEEIGAKNPTRRTSEERAFLANYQRWDKRYEFPTEEPDHPTHVENNQQAADEVRSLAESKPPEPLTEQEAKENVDAAEGRQESVISETVRTQAEALDVNAGTTEQEINQRVQVADEAAKTLRMAVQQSADAAGKAAPKGDYPRGGGIPITARGRRTEVSVGTESHPAQYALVDAEAPIVSHRWNGNNIEENEQFAPREMQYRPFDEKKTKRVLGEAQPDNFRAGNYLDATNGPERGPSVLDSVGRVVGGNTRLLRLKKWLENISRISDPEVRDVQMALFNESVRRFAASVGIDRVPDDGRIYIPVRILDKPIETIEEAARLGRIFNDPSSDQVTEDMTALSNGKLLMEADARERQGGEPGILSEIGNRLAGNEVSTVRAAINDSPQWFAQKARQYFHIADTEENAWFSGTGEEAVLTDTGKDRFILALVATHLPDVQAVRALINTDAESSLTRAIGTVTALRAYPDRDLTEKVTEAVAAAAKTKRFRQDGNKPIPAWNRVYANGTFSGFGLDKPKEPSRISQAIYLALLDSKTTRLNSALKDMIAGEPGMGMLFAPAVEGKELHSAADYFNVAFRPELQKIAESQGRKSFSPVTQDEFEAALENRDWIPPEDRKVVEEKPQEVKAEATPNFGPPPASRKKGLEPPPGTETQEQHTARRVSTEKEEQGYITPQTFREMLNTLPNTRERASDNYHVAEAIARVRWEKAKPEGVERKDSLGWLLKEIGFRGIEKGRDELHRGEYDFANGIMRLNKAADETTFIHEFIHAISPLLTEEEWKAVDTIKVDKAAYKKITGKEWKHTGMSERMEKLAYGWEKFYRDENAVDFRSGFELRKVLKNIKEMFVAVYKKMQSDPLSPFKLSEEARQLIAEHNGIEGFDQADKFRTETEEAERERRRLKKPAEVLNPVHEIAKEAGLYGTPERFVRGTVLSSTKGTVKPNQSVSFFVDGYDSAEEALRHIERGMKEGKKGTDAADIIETDDGRFAVRFNTPKGIVLYQDLPPESRGDMGVRLKTLKKELAGLPPNKILDRQFLQMRIDDLENKIEAAFGNEEREPKADPEVTQKYAEEKRNERANRVREGTHAAAGIQRPPTVDRVSKEAELGMRGHGASGSAGGAGGDDGIDAVKPISMPPLRFLDKPVAGKTTEDAPETPETWKKRLTDSGMSEESPLPIYALESRTARILDDDRFPGQTATTQIAMSGLQRGDGVVVANTTGTGKGYVAMAIASEFGRDREGDDKPLILYITKNGPLIDKTREGPAESFGIDLKKDTPEFGVKNGTYAVTYQKALNNPVYQNIKWDLVIADESGEARNWFREAKNKKGINQGQMLMAIMRSAKKGVYMSATPFHAPMEYGYLEKLNLWPKGQFNDWVSKNFDTHYRNGKLVGRLNPEKQARFRQQLIQRGQMTSQAISYDGFNTHFGVVPITNAMKNGLGTIATLMERARTKVKLSGGGPSAKSISAYEAQFTKAFLEREMLPQAIDLAKKGIDQGYDVIIASPTTDEDLFRRERHGEPTVFQKMDDSMNGQFSRLLPRLPNVYDILHGEFGDAIGNYSGVGQTDAVREQVRKDFQNGKSRLVYMSIPAGGLGADWHDTKGDRPRLMIVLGPPYSGVMLEQLLGRTWRFGVKSDAHVMFLGTDAAPQVRLMKTIVAPRMRSLRAAVHGIKDSLATAMENYSTVERERARQDTMEYAIGGQMQVKAADYGIRHPGRVVGIDSWDALQLPPATEAMNKGMKFGEGFGGDWTTLYQEKQDAFKPPPSVKDVRAEKAINNVAESAAKNPAIPEQVISLGAAHASEVADMAPEGIDAAEAGSYAMKAALQGNGFDYDPETGQWKAPLGVVAKMLGRDTSAIDEREAHYLKSTIGMNFEQRVISAARKIGAERQVRNVLNRMYDYDQAKEGYAGKLEMGLLEVFTKNGLNPNPESWLEKKGREVFGRPQRDDVRRVMDVVKGLAASDDPRINKAAEELRQWMADARDLMAKKGVHRADGSTFAEVQRNPRYVPQITDWNTKLTDPQTGETKTLAEVVDDQTLDDVSKMRYFEKTRQELNAGVDSMRQWLRDLKIDREHRLNRPKNPNVTMPRTINHPFYRKDIWALMRYSDQVASALAMEDTLGHDMGRISRAIAEVPSRKLRKDLKQDVDSTFEYQDWSTTMGKVVRKGQAFEAISKMLLSPASVALHNIHAAMNLGIKPWFKAQIRILSHPREMMREKYYSGVVMIKMNPALLEGPHRGPAGKYFDLSGFSAIYRWQRAAVAETAWAWMEQDALSDLRAGGKRAETSRRLLKDRLLLSDDEINRAVANNRWDDESKYKAERVFADKVAFSERTSQMPRTARLSMAEDLSEAEKNLHAAARGAYMLQSFQIKTYSGMKEWLFDEVFHHHNYRPLLPLFLLYPAAGFVLMNVKGAIVGGFQRGFEKATGQNHTQDRWDRLFEEYKDIEKHPWVGPLKLYLDSMLIGMANERIKRWTDIGMMAAMGQKKKLENLVQYAAVDELDQLVGGLYADIFSLAATPGKAWYDYMHTKTPAKKLKAAEKDVVKEAKSLAWPLGTIPKINEWAGMKKITPPPR